MVIGSLFKQPHEVFRFRLELGPWLAGAALTDVQLTQHDPPPPTGPLDPSLPAVLTVSMIWIDGTGDIEFFFSGGTDGDRGTYSVVSTTSDGRVREDELEIKVKELSFHG